MNPKQIPIIADQATPKPSADAGPQRVAQTLPHYMRPGTLQFQALPPLSLYVHLPWCLKKCPYCDFNSHEWRAGGAIPEQTYLAALRADLDAVLPRHPQLAPLDRLIDARVRPAMAADSAIAIA